MTRPLTVLSVAFPFANVGTDAVGGAEQVLSAIDNALTRSGHRSIVVAGEGSRIAGELIAIPWRDGVFIDESTRASVHRAVRVAVDGAIRGSPIDVVHLHGIDFHSYLPPAGPPALVTLHLPPAWYPPEALRPKRPDIWLHGVSSTQHHALRRIVDEPMILPPIENGVPVAALSANRHARRGFALMLGRVCPEKNQHLGLDAARIADVPLLMAGEVFPYAAHQSYFETKIVPRLDARRRWIGPVGFARKRRLLSSARCLLVPSLAPETSSLVAMEAAACGTPVIALPSGALADLVEPGRTGFLATDAETMAAAITRTHTIDAEECRRVARARFSVASMTDAYLQRYRTLTMAAVGE